MRMCKDCVWGARYQRYCDSIFVLHLISNKDRMMQQR